MASDGNSSVGLTVLVVLLGCWLAWSYSCKVSQCDYVCKKNSDAGDYVLMQGCYCKDTKGRLYNPRDSR